jgi:hypothetical protein
MNILTNLYDLARSSLGMGMTHNGKRDTWTIFGYPDTLAIKDFRDKYKRGDIATRIVDAYPSECWANPPLIIENKKEQDRTPWENEVDILLDSLDFWQKIKKLDTLVNLGRYAVLYIGFKDGKDLKEPANKNTEAIFLKPLAEDVAHIKSYVTDPQDKRFGLPEMYELTLLDGTELTTEVKREVHHSRVIHIAERTLDKEYIGQSVLEPIWNKLIDLEKVSGGSAEIFWLNARGGMSLEADADADLGNPEDKKALKEEIENYQHNLTRVVRTKGIKIQAITQKIDSPKDQFDICISIIAGTTAIPKRILLGNEAGELGSSQDETNWSKQIKNRQKNFCEPFIINKFIDYMIEMGVLKKHSSTKYSCEWPSLTNVSDKDKAEIASKKSSAIATYANSMTAETIIPPKQFVEEVLEMEYREDEIDDIIKRENEEIDRSLKENPIVKLHVAK